MLRNHLPCWILLGAFLPAGLAFAQDAGQVAGQVENHLDRRIEQYWPLIVEGSLPLLYHGIAESNRGVLTRVGDMEPYLRDAYLEQGRDLDDAYWLRPRLRLSPGRTRFDFDRPPGIRVEPGKIRLECPAQNPGLSMSHESNLWVIHTVADIYETVAGIKLHGAVDLTLGFAVVVTIDADGIQEEDVEVEVRSMYSGANALGAFADLADSVAGNPIDDIIDESATKEIRKMVLEMLAEYPMQGILNFDPAPLVYAREVELVQGERRLFEDSAIDLVLIADGYDESEMADFDAAVQALVAGLLSDGPEAEPFTRFRSVLRVWKVSLVTGSPSERIMTSRRELRSTGGQLQWTTKNDIQRPFRLARVRAEHEMGDVYVIVNRGVPARSSALLDQVHLMLDNKGLAASVDVLLHELGHTLLGNLADEYLEEDGEWLGPEPFEPNMTRAESPASGKWAHWVGRDLEPWDAPIENLEGGMHFRDGIYRPTGDCKMDGEWQPFCAVCREAMTIGMHRAVADGVPVLRAELLAPVEGTYELSFETNRTRRLPVPRDGTATGLRLSVTACPLPEPWAFQWTHRRADGSLVSIRNEASPTLDVRFGDSIDLRIESTCSFAPGHELPVFEGKIDLDIPLPGLDGTVTAPRELNQVGLVPLRLVGIGDTVEPAFIPWSGRTSLRLSLVAAAGGLRPYDDAGNVRVPVRIRFDLYRHLWLPGRATGFRLLAESHTSPVIRPGQSIDWRPGPQAPGSYSWTARTVVLGRESEPASLPAAGGCQFVIAPPTPTAAAVDPNKPVDPRVRLVDPARGSYELAATGWDMNADDVRFEFQYRPAGLRTRYLSQSTGWFSIPAAEIDLRRTGTVRHEARFGSSFEWRVRTVDETGRKSPWTYGPGYGGKSKLTH